jgi:hypothetical protein
MQIIQLWCGNIEIFFGKVEKKDARIPKQIDDDYNEFLKIESSLQDFLKKIYV